MVFESNSSVPWERSWLLHCWYTVVTLLLHCCYTVVTLLLQSCYTLVTLLLHRGSDHGQAGGVCGGTTLCTSLERWSVYVCVCAADSRQQTASLEKGSGCVAVTVLEKNSYSAKE
jgi:hypothetical protein